MGCARIVLQRAGDGQTAVWQAEQRLRIGRLSRCDVVLDDASISRQHAEVLFTDSGWMVRDLGSTNGTLLNGVRLGRMAQRLHLGDHLQPGRILLHVTQLDEPAPADDDANQPEQLGPAVVSQAYGTATATFSVLEPDTAPAAERPRRVSVEANTAADPVRTFLVSSLRGAVDALGAHGGAVLLWEAHARKLVLKASCRAGGTEATLAHAHKLIQRCYQQGTVLAGKDIEEDAPQAATRSLLCLPLRDGDCVLGVVFVERAGAQPFTDRDQLLGQALAHTLSAGIVSSRQLLAQQHTLFMQTMLSLADAVDCRDPCTAGHTQRVTEYVLLLAEELQVSTADYQHLQLGTPLHDIGKIGIDEAIFRKPGRLTPAEFAAIKNHPTRGVALLASIPELDPVLPIIGSHHEHWDGSGYPDGLIGEIIPPLARMVTVADVFDALTSDRAYRKALSPAEAFSYLQRNAGTLFDPYFTQTFLRLQPQLESRLRERNTMTATKRELDELKQVLQTAGAARIRRPV